MLVDAQGRFITQREQPRLALVDVAIQPDALQVGAPGMPALELSISAGADAASVEAEVWGYRGPALDAGEAAHAWFSAWLGGPCRLVRCPPTPTRPVDPRYVSREAYVSFADGFPELLISEGSIDDLSRRAGQTFPVDRFRPNLLVTGCDAYAEDSWRHLRIGELELDVVKPCARCVIITTDQATAARSPEPLATLASYRRQGKGVMFGQNCVHRNTGTIRVGDEVEVLARAPSA
jgi:uncharacterized protein YcbX